MEVKFNKPYLISWLAIPLFIFLGVVYRQASVSVQLHASYYVFSVFHVALLSSLFLGLIGLGYWVAIRQGRKLRPVLSLFHLVSTISILAILTFFDVVFSNIGFDALIVVALLLFLLFAQLMFLANFLCGSSTR